MAWALEVPTGNIPNDPFTLQAEVKTIGTLESDMCTFKCRFLFDSASTHAVECLSKCCLLTKRSIDWIQQQINMIFWRKHTSFLTLSFFISKHDLKMATKPSQLENNNTLFYNISKLLPNSPLSFLSHIHVINFISIAAMILNNLTIKYY